MCYMRNVYVCIKHLKDKMDFLIDGNIENLQKPEVINISQELDKLIYKSMLLKDEDKSIKSKSHS
ncbi:Spo0E family sporulation regulatory protein-aspartic acid phosphatase [Alkalibaculum sp. M08DMB]|uniref:Spo0E family sporulation regulatory protein-aspartic acid phosphatase n=2 Tax=Alkalibaculum sporogenes TaxID=2655001 RepID=A0A6A7K6B0_9FIRM|nr:Spo0E family sporulation regulatory protein-aspartic acid phosphatase [Alkalibaculum sporogenes]